MNAMKAEEYGLVVRHAQPQHGLPYSTIEVFVGKGPRIAALGRRIIAWWQRDLYWEGGGHRTKARRELRKMIEAWEERGP